ncbi:MULTISPECIES: DUF5681 domain-containing protein [Metallibacterium]|jgi:hypothetical protein|uniref:DUF5681 domain-containing protein n=1 Tax=Metallibacterium TaxID=1218803 RepID=UPI002619B3F9|nr:MULTISPECIES: DUF5681 domain-containing protein [Metallibacterium]MBW8075771.1 hypothetical protein [Metallibacterium scheffleri]
MNTTPSRASVKRPRGRPWRPGQSGNPSGHPKDYREVVALAREHTSRAIAILVEMMESPQVSDSARVRAAELILERGWGKAVQPIAGNLDDDPIDLRLLPTLSDAQLMAIIVKHTQDGSSNAR